MHKEEQDDCQFLLSLVPTWAKHVQAGLGPTMYGTGSYKGDMKVKARVDEIEARLMKPSEERHSCVSRMGSTYAYLADGTKVVVQRDPDVKGRVWLEHKEQDKIIACSSAPVEVDDGI